MLSKKQKDVINYIGKFLAEKGYSPSYDEIGAGTGISSKSTIFKYIKILKEKGIVSNISGKKRSLFLTDFARKILAGSGVFMAHWDKASKNLEESRVVPLYGYIEAGYPVEAVQVEEIVSIPEGFYAGDRGKLFALKVRGDSMIDDMIRNGDTIILRKTSEAPNGKIVAAIIDGYEATLKRYYAVKGGLVKLMPSNPTFQPVILEAARVKIIGELVGLTRRY